MNDLYHNIVFLYGACTQPEVQHFINNWCSPEDVGNIGRTMESWKRASSIFRGYTETEKNISETIGIRDVPDGLSEAIEEIKNEPGFKKTFSQLSTEIKFVEIEKIIAPQRFINTDFVNEMKRSVDHRPSDRELMNICLRPIFNKQPPLSVHISDNTFVYSDKDPRFKYIGGYTRNINFGNSDISPEGGMPVTSVVLLFGYDYGAINAYQVNKRVVLNNGFHRLYMLFSMGIKYAPMVLQKINYPELEFPPIFKNFPRDYLLSHPRPAMLRGFFNPDMICNLRMKKMVSNVRVSWTVDQFYGPPTQ